MDDKYLIVILVLAILFGASRLPLLGRNFGQGIREFKKGIADGAQQHDVADSDDSDQREPPVGPPGTAAADAAARPARRDDARLAVERAEHVDPDSPASA